MDLMLKISALVLVITIINIVIRSIKPEISVAISIVGVLVVLLALTPEIVKIKEAAGELVDYSKISLVFKVTGITYISGLTADLCRSSGENSLALCAELAGKIMVIMLTLPLVGSLLELIKNMI